MRDHDPKRRQAEPRQPEATDTLPYRARRRRAQAQTFGGDSAAGSRTDRATNPTPTAIMPSIINVL